MTGTAGGHLSSNSREALPPGHPPKGSTMIPSTLVDRRSRAAWDDRRNDLGQLPSAGIRTQKVVRTTSGRRMTDRVDAAPVFPHPSMVAPTITGASGFIETDAPYYMPSGQRIA